MRPDAKSRATSFVLAFFLVSITTSAFLESAEAAGPGGAEISILTTHVRPARQESSTGKATFTVEIVLENRGKAPGVVRLTLADSEGTFFDEPVEVSPARAGAFTCNWTVNGTGKHNATATVSGENASSPMTADMRCELAYIPVENPSPWYTIPCAFLFIIVPSVGIWLLIRRSGGGDWLEKKDDTSSNRSTKK